MPQFDLGLGDTLRRRRSTSSKDLTRKPAPKTDAATEMLERISDSFTQAPTVTKASQVERRPGTPARPSTVTAVPQDRPENKSLAEIRSKDPRTLEWIGAELNKRGFDKTPALREQMMRYARAKIGGGEAPTAEVSGRVLNEMLAQYEEAIKPQRTKVQGTYVGGVLAGSRVQEPDGSTPKDRLTALVSQWKRTADDYATARDNRHMNTGELADPKNPGRPYSPWQGGDPSVVQREFNRQELARRQEMLDQGVAYSPEDVQVNRPKLTDAVDAVRGAARYAGMDGGVVGAGLDTAEAIAGQFRYGDNAKNLATSIAKTERGNKNFMLKNNAELYFGEAMYYATNPFRTSVLGFSGGKAWDEVDERLRAASDVGDFAFQLVASHMLGGGIATAARATKLGALAGKLGTGAKSMERAIKVVDYLADRAPEFFLLDVPGYTKMVGDAGGDAGKAAAMFAGQILDGFNPDVYLDPKRTIDEKTGAAVSAITGVILGAAAYRTARNALRAVANLGPFDGYSVRAAMRETLSSGTYLPNLVALDEGSWKVISRTAEVMQQSGAGSRGISPEVEKMVPQMVMQLTGSGVPQEIAVARVNAAALIMDMDRPDPQSEARFTELTAGEEGAIGNNPSQSEPVAGDALPEQAQEVSLNTTKEVPNELQDPQGQQGQQGRGQGQTEPSAGLLTTTGAGETRPALTRRKGVGNNPFTEETLPVADVGVLPNMQIKRDVDPTTGAADWVKHAKPFNEGSPPVSVWRRNDGSLWIMNGHHRLQIAKLNEYPELRNARVFNESDGISFEMARGIGALENVMEGTINPLDASLVLRDLGYNGKDLEGMGISPKTRVYRDAVALAKLTDQSLEEVLNGRVKPEAAAGIADVLANDPARMDAVIRKARSVETRELGEAMAREAANIAMVQKDDGSGNLFGEIEDDVPLEEIAKIKTDAVKRIAADQRRYASVAKGSAAGSTSIDKDAQLSAAEREAKVREIVDRAVVRSPELQRLIEEEAAKYAKKPDSRTLNSAVEAVIAAANRIIGGDSERTKPTEAPSRSRAPKDQPDGQRARNDRASGERPSEQPEPKANSQQVTQSEAPMSKIEAAKAKLDARIEELDKIRAAKISAIKNKRSGAVDIGPEDIEWVAMKAIRLALEGAERLERILLRLFKEEFFNDSQQQATREAVGRFASEMEIEEEVGLKVNIPPIENKTKFTPVTGNESLLADPGRWHEHQFDNAALGEEGSPKYASYLDKLEAEIESAVLNQKVIVVRSSWPKPVRERVGAVALRWGSPRVLIAEGATGKRWSELIAQGSEAERPWALWRHQWDGQADLLVRKGPAREKASASEPVKPTPKADQEETEPKSFYGLREVAGIRIGYDVKITGSAHDRKSLYRLHYIEPDGKTRHSTPGTFSTQKPTAKEAEEAIKSHIRGRIESWMSENMPDTGYLIQSVGVGAEWDGQLRVAHQDGSVLGYFGAGGWEKTPQVGSAINAAPTVGRGTEAVEAPTTKDAGSESPAKEAKSPPTDQAPPAQKEPWEYTVQEWDDSARRYPFEENRRQYESEFAGIADWMKREGIDITGFDSAEDFINQALSSDRKWTKGRATGLTPRQRLTVKGRFGNTERAETLRKGLLKLLDLKEHKGVRLPTLEETARSRDFHKRSVERAYAEGKPVPAEVLADYPDLKPKPAEPRSRFRELVLEASKTAGPDALDQNSPTGRRVAQEAFATVKKEFPHVQTFGDLDKNLDRTANPVKKSAPVAAPRLLDPETYRTTDGKPINPGDTFETSSGRVTTPYPKQKRLRAHSEWLIENAILEAEARGDDYNLTRFRGEKPLSDGTLPQASSEDLHLYLFGDRASGADTPVETPYKPGEKYHQPVPEITRIDPKLLRVLDTDNEVTRVSDEVAASMDFTEPVQATVFYDGTIGIRDGHHRSAAAKQRGLEAIPVEIRAINAKGEVLNDLIAQSKSLEGAAIPKPQSTAKRPGTPAEAPGGALFDVPEDDFALTPPPMDAPKQSATRIDQPSIEGDGPEYRQQTLEDATDEVGQFGDETGQFQMKMDGEPVAPKLGGISHKVDLPTGTLEVPPVKPRSDAAKQAELARMKNRGTLYEVVLQHTGTGQKFLVKYTPRGKGPLIVARTVLDVDVPKDHPYWEALGAGKWERWFEGDYMVIGPKGGAPVWRAYATGRTKREVVIDGSDLPRILGDDVKFTKPNSTEQPILKKEPDAKETPSEQPSATGRSDSDPGRVPGRSPDSLVARGESGQGQGKQGGGNTIVTARRSSVQPSKPEVVPSDLLPHLDDHQVHGASLAIAAMDMPTQTFLNADGTGTGKTRQILAFAETMARSGKKILIVAPNEVLGKPWQVPSNPTISGSYANDSKAMGVTITLAAGNERLVPGEILITTYHRFEQFRGQIDANTYLVFDEAQNLKNYFPYENNPRTKSTGRAVSGVSMIEQSAGVFFASATPADTPKSIQYLNARGALAKALPPGSGVYVDPGKNILSYLGYEEVTKKNKRGGFEVYWFLRKGNKESRIAMDNLIGNMTEEGRGIKREIAMDGVDVKIDNLKMPEEYHEQVNRIEEFFAANPFEENEDGSKVPIPVSRAVILGHIRRAQEPHKIADAVSRTKESLAAGEQVVIFSARVNDSEIGKWEIVGFEPDGAPIRERVTLETTKGTIPVLKKALIDAGISESEIAEIHGGTDERASDAMRRFQSGDAKVVVATIESGGTGINLDDVAGDRPRHMIIITAPFSALPNMQAIGRVWRLKTKSKPKITYLMGDTEIDKWNGGILARKMHDLGAVVQGEAMRVAKDLSPDDMVEDFFKEKTADADAITDNELGIPYTITKGVHTKEGYDIWVAQAGKYLSAEDFNAERNRAKQYGGYYSSYGKLKGFLFKSEAEANAFTGKAETKDVGAISDEATATVPTDGYTRTFGNADLKFDVGSEVAVYVGGKEEYQPATVTNILHGSEKAHVKLANGDRRFVEFYEIYPLDRATSTQKRDTYISTDPLPLLEEQVKKAKIEGYFPTPTGLAARMGDLLEIEPGMTVLEPSAGRGNLAEVAKSLGAEVDVAEINPQLRGILTQRGFNLIGDDAMDIQGQYDRIIMNPPFENRMDATHVMQAYHKNLKPGGRLVAIMGEGPFFASDKTSVTFRAWLASVGGTSEKLPEGTFKDSDVKTMVNTRLIVIDKPSVSDTKTLGSRWSSLRDPRGPGIAPISPTDAPLKSGEEIIRTLADSLGKHVHRKRMRSNVNTGEYNPVTKMVSVRFSGDVQAALHEIGHYLDDIYDVTSGRHLDKELLPLADPYVSKGSPMEERRREGFAAFVHAWAVNPDATEPALPETTMSFKAKLPSESVAAIRGAGYELRRLAGSDPIRRAETRVRMDENRAEAKRRLTNILQSFGLHDDGENIRGMKSASTWMYHFFDDLAPFEKAVEEVRRRSGMDAKFSIDEILDDPVGWARDLNYSANKIDDILRHGMVNADNERVTGGMYSIFHHLDGTNRQTLEDDLRAMVLYGIGERTMEKVKNLVGEAEDEAAALMKLAEANAALEHGDDMDTWPPEAFVPIEAAKEQGDALIAKAMRQAETLTGIGSGIVPDYDEAMSIIRQVQTNPAQHARIQKSLAAYREFSDALLEYMVEKGRLSRDGAEIIRSENQFYFALNRVMDDVDLQQSKGSSRKLGSAKQPIKLFRGSTRQIENPIVSLMTHAEQIIRETDRNHALATFIKMISEATSKQAFGIGETFLDDIAYRATPEEAAGKTSIKVWVNGQEQHWVIDPALHESIKQAGLVLTHPWFLKWVGGLSQLIRRSITSHPAFALFLNPIRDAQSRLVLSRTGSKFKGILSRITPIERELYALYGGGVMEHHFSGRKSYYDVQSELIRKSLAHKGIKDSIILNVQQFREVYATMMSTPEIQNRIVEYRNARQKAIDSGRSEHEANLYAMRQARELMDFMRAGKTIRFLNAYIPFLNAQMQGMARAASGAKEDPVGFAKRWMIYALAPTALNYAYNAMQGKENEEEYLALPDYQRDMFYNIRVPGYGWVRIPKAFEMGIAASAFERAIRSGRGDEHGWDGYMRSFGSVVGIEDTTLLGPATPYIEIKANRDFFKNRAIIPQYEADLAPELREGSSSASVLGKAMAQMFGKDPREWDHLINAYFGRIGKTATDIGKMGNEKAYIGPMQWIYHATGLTSEVPGFNSPDVQWVLDQAKSYGVRGALRDEIDDFMSAKNVEQRKATAKAMRDVAKEKRSEIESVLKEFKGAQERSDAIKELFSSK